MSAPFRADQVGSLLRPRALIEARQRHARGELEAPQLRRLEDEAIRDTISHQKSIGLRAVTDGEFRRAYWHEDEEDLRRRIEEAARHAPLEQLCLSPQCGFASDQIGNKLSQAEQWRKLELVASVARKDWGEDA